MLCHVSADTSYLADKVRKHKGYPAAPPKLNSCYLEEAFFPPNWY